MSRLFISHSSKDTWVERDIVDRLRERGVSTWFSKNDIRGAEEFNSSIIAALQSCEWFAVVMTPNAATSVWVRGEVIWAFENRRGRIIPIMGRKCQPQDIYVPLGAIQITDYQHDSAAAIDDIVRRVGSAKFPSVTAPPATLPLRRWPIKSLTMGLGAMLVILVAITLFAVISSGGSHEDRTEVRGVGTGRLPTTVHFDKCSTVIADASTVIPTTADWMRNNPSARLEIIGSIEGAERLPGDCDIDPSMLALRRAWAVREDLRKAGVSADRIKVDKLDGNHSTGRGDEPDNRVAKLLRQ